MHTKRIPHILIIHKMKCLEFCLRSIHHTLVENKKPAKKNLPPNIPTTSKLLTKKNNQNMCTAKKKLYTTKKESSWNTLKPKQDNIFRTHIHIKNTPNI